MKTLNHRIPKNALITIAGTVGVGKSTLAVKLAEALDFNTSLEKVDNNPYLEDYYSNFEKWSFHLQIYFLAERFKQQKKIAQSGAGCVQDRSIYEDAGIFARLQYEQGNMSQRDYDTYRSLFDAMTMTPYFLQPDLLIYLEGSYEQVVRRIKQRGRSMELQASDAFWKELYKRYEMWIDGFSLCPVLRINIEEYDLISAPQSIESLIEKISLCFEDSLETVQAR